MDEINDFFGFHKPLSDQIERRNITVSNTVQKCDDQDNVEFSKTEILGTEYAKKYQEKEEVEMFESSNFVNECSAMDEMEDMDCISMNSSSAGDFKLPNIYENYVFEYKPQNNLPIHNLREEIITTINSYSVVIIQGATGCGKTTQVPQFILDEAYKNKKECNIIVTQPRRIAAVSIARRVCSERLWELGTVAGYQIGLDKSCMSNDTRLLYCTTGVFLQKLIKMKDINMYTHIVLDEIHERSYEMDFLFILLRKLCSYGNKLKIILMSATINAYKFSEYFKFLKTGELFNAPIINVENQNTYTVNKYYLCQLKRLNITADVNFDNPGISKNMFIIAIKLLMVFEYVDREESKMGSEVLSKKPSVLIFLPGIYEIEQMNQLLTTYLEQNTDYKYLILLLHSTINGFDQQQIFRLSPPNVRKIILSTNIAESSITIPDVKYVIDFCLTKQLETNSNTNFTSLRMTWASKHNCEQRAGRAGRIMNGRVYRLVTKEFYENLMPDSNTPEILRCPLENIILKTKILDIGAPHSILALAMDPPKLSDIRNSVLILKAAGGLSKTINDIYDDFDGDITFIGRIMSILPLDIKLSKLIILGYIFSVLDECIIISAGLSGKSIFTNSYSHAVRAYSQKLRWSDCSGSDLISILNVYIVWAHYRQQNNINDKNENLWANRYFISIKNLKEMTVLINEIKERLTNSGIKKLSGIQAVQWSDKEKAIILKIVIAGAFLPNYFSSLEVTQQSRENDIYKTMNLHDPYTTVYFIGLESKYIGQLYEEQIKNLFFDCGIPPNDIKLSFDTTQKVYITFINQKNVLDIGNFDLNNKYNFSFGHIPTEVYKAIKMAQINNKHKINVATPAIAAQILEQQGFTLTENQLLTHKTTNKDKVEEDKNLHTIVLPSINQITMFGRIMHIDHCNKFWFMPQEQINVMENFLHQLNTAQLEHFSNCEDIKPGLIVAAPYTKGLQTIYHRAKILDIKNDGNHISCEIYYIDIGDVAITTLNELRKLSGSLKYLINYPPRIFLCSLAEIKPSSINCPRRRWTKEALELFEKITRNKNDIQINVYSVVLNIVSVTTIVDNENINDLLVTCKLAQISEENLMSKMDHDNRIRMQKQVVHSTSTDKFKQREENYYNEYENITPPAKELCAKSIYLSGPYSPLETKVYAKVLLSTMKPVKIDNQSVNSVLLESDPQDMHEKLMVAASVSEINNKNALSIHNTTIMPNIPGFPALIALIFCPTMEIRHDKLMTRYTSILTGLGLNPLTNRSLYPDNDIEFHLDVDITQHDIQDINQIRYIMDTLLYTRPGQKIPNISDDGKNKSTEKLKQLIIELLEKKRQRVNVIYTKNSNVWGEMDKLYNVVGTSNPYKNRAIFQFHKSIVLKPVNNETKIKLKKSCAELHEYVKLSYISNFTPIECKLCDETLSTITHARIHLLSQLHRDRESQIHFNLR